MSAISSLFKKELKELITPATILPIVMMAVIFGSLGGAINSIEDNITSAPVIGYINEDSGNFSDLVVSILEQSEVAFSGSSVAQKEEALSTLQQQNGAALIIIPQNFSSDLENNVSGALEVTWILKGTGISDISGGASVDGLLYQIGTSISNQIIETQSNESINASHALMPLKTNHNTYFKGQEIENIGAEMLIGIFSSQNSMIPIVMMLIILTSGGMVISSMALEKENKTLETLLTLPIKRTHIVSSKIVAAALVGLLFASVYLVGFNNYMGSLTGGASFDLSAYGFSISSVEMILLGLIVFLTLIAGLSLCMLLGTLATNYKSAQTLTFPITLFALIPMFITMFADFTTLPLPAQIGLFLIPFTHPMIAPTQLMLNNYSLVMASLLYVGVFSAITIMIVVWVFKTDRLITGANFKWLKKFKELRRR